MSAANWSHIESFQKVNSGYQYEEYYCDDNAAGRQLYEEYLSVQQHANNNWYKESPNVQNWFFDLWVLQSIQYWEASQRRKYGI